jgi:2-hydroxychromene-2-carboxylate isomerase
MPTNKNTANTAPRFYFSLRSPYSWLAYREVMTRHQELAARLEWLPFYEPDPATTAQLDQQGGRFAYTDMSKEKWRYILQDVKRLAGARGLTVAWPVDRDPVWEIPHLAWFAADREGRGHDYIDAVYRARFGQGRNVCDPATIADIGRELGLDPDRLAHAAADPELRAAGVGALVRAGRDGVFGVPFFVDRFTRFWGLDRLDAFTAHLRSKEAKEAKEPKETPAEPAPEPLAAVGASRSADGGHAGGCG